MILEGEALILIGFKEDKMRWLCDRSGKWFWWFMGDWVRSTIALDESQHKALYKIMVARAEQENRTTPYRFNLQGDLI